MGLKLKNQILGVLLLFSFLAYNSGTTLFQHTHIVDGVEVTHSHPYQPSNHHSHSSSAITAIGLIGNGVIALTTAIIAFCCFRHITAIYGTFSDYIRVYNGTRHAQLRAPPAL